MAAFFGTRNIHTLHSPVYLCLMPGCLGVSLCWWAPILERGVFTHLFRLVLHSSLTCVVRYTCANVYGRLFLEREIFTHFIRLFICVWGFRYVCERLFKNEEYSHTFFACLFVLDLLASMVASRVWRYVTSRLGSSRSAPTWRLVSDRHHPPTFSVPEVHFRYPFSRHDFRCDGRDSR